MACDNLICRDWCLIACFFIIRYKPAVKCIYEYIEEFPVDMGDISSRLFDMMERLPEAEDSSYVVAVENVDNVIVKNATTGNFNWPSSSRGAQFRTDCPFNIEKQAH